MVLFEEKGKHAQFSSSLKDNYNEAVCGSERLLFSVSHSQVDNGF